MVTDNHMVPASTKEPPTEETPVIPKRVVITNVTPESSPKPPPRVVISDPITTKPVQTDKSPPQQALHIKSYYIKPTSLASNHHDGAYNPVTPVYRYNTRSQRL